ncbi:BA75_01944T0 [Komagataella pastoris]|uniref:Large ribosomal subunit protein mL49 n=1 Tax=Komagataella pastoris TaxID=4922 RepID=A0A1B2JC34_PICPA|nr:BA75_01944T0 [Komagataella pastoris]
MLSFRRFKSSVFGDIKTVDYKDLLGYHQVGGLSKTYFVPRTSKGNLPVYKDYKRKVPYTEIRRVSGDLTSLRNDLQEALKGRTVKNDYKCMIQSQKVIIKGNHVEAVTKLLAEKF